MSDSKKDLLERVKRIVSTVGKMPDRANDDGAPGVKAYLKNKDKPNKVVKFNPNDTVKNEELTEMKKMKPNEFAKLSPKERKAYIDTHKAAAASKASYGSKKKAAKPAPEKKEPEVDDRSVGERLLDHDKSNKTPLKMGSVRTHTQKIAPHLRGSFQQHLAHNDHEHGAFMDNPKEYIKGWLHGRAAQNRKKSGGAMNLSLGGPAWSHPNAKKG